MYICKELLAMQRMQIVHFKFSKYVPIIYINIHIHRKNTHKLIQIVLSNEIMSDLNILLILFSYFMFF